MNYYPFHIGDYLSATRHLSWEEDAAYRRLLDTYYTTEKPLPAELRAVCRLVLATTDSQREAVRTVLDEFFEPTEEGWINRRADAEIQAMRDKQQKQRDKANKRWGMQRGESGTADAMPRHEQSDAAASKADAEAMPPTPTPTPTPTPNTEANASVGAKRATRKAPADFTVTPELQAWAAEHAKLVDLQVETAKFLDHTFGTSRSDWVGTWRNWMRKAQQDAMTRGRPVQSRAQQATSFGDTDYGKGGLL